MAQEQAMELNNTQSPDSEVPEDRRKLVAKWAQMVRGAKSHWSDQFERMKEDMEFAKGLQWEGQSELKDDRYTANLVQRHVAQRTAALYAKNPKAVARKRNRMDFQVWDGSQESLMMAMQQVQMAQQQLMQAGFLPDQARQGALQMAPQAARLMQDFVEGSQRRELSEKMAKTLELVFSYFIGEQRHGFKRQMKQLVRRVQTCGIGYIKLGFAREYEIDSDVDARLDTATNQLAHMRQLAEKAMTGDKSGDDSEADTAELESMIKDLQQQREFISREGLVFDFPLATAVIPDPNTRQLAGGFVGAKWIAEEFVKTPEEVQKIYGVDLKQKFKSYSTEGKEKENQSHAWVAGDERTPQDSDHACIWEIYSQETGQKLVIADGYDDFLKEPGPPYPQLERFFPIFALAFNEREDECDPFPISDVRLLRHAQMEYNRLKEGLRQHRIANRPLYAAPAGVFEEDDVESLANHPAHGIVKLQALEPGQAVSDVLQPVQKYPIDPNLYEVSSSYTDFQRIGGSQEANLGGTSGSTATEANIAESSRVSALSSNVDDMDELLTEIARESGTVLLLEMSAEKIKEIAGPGAVWPELSRADATKEIFLEIEAGSSGKPNKAQEIMNLERAAPFLMQIPGISPKWVGERFVKAIDENVNITDAIIEGAKSMMAMNDQRQIGTADAQTDPNQQGGQGGKQGEQSSPAGAKGPEMTEQTT